MAYLVHHSLNRNGTHTGGKRNTLPIEEKNSLTDKSQHKNNSEINKSTLLPIQNQWTKE